MAIDATYISYNSFNINGNQTEKFDPGRAILAYHTNSGAKLIYVDYATYDATNGITTVNTLQTESENLASDLISIDYSCIKPDTSGIGNISADVLWLYRGLRKYMYWYWATGNSFVLTSGMIHINDGVKDKICILPGNLTITFSLSPYSWAYIYAGIPSNSLILTSSDITVNKTAPTLNYSKCGYYDSTGTKRCIGFFWLDAAGTAYWFYGNNTCFYCLQSSHVEPIISTSWAYQSFDVPVIENLYVHFTTSLGDTNTATVTGQIKETADPDEGTYVYNKITTYSERMHGSVTVFMDASCRAYLKNSASQRVKLSTSLIYLPFGLSGQC